MEFVSLTDRPPRALSLIQETLDPIMTQTEPHWLFTDVDTDEHFAVRTANPIDAYLSASSQDMCSIDHEFMADGEIRLILDDAVRIQIWKEEHRDLVDETQYPGGIDAATYGR